MITVENREANPKRRTQIGLSLWWVAIIVFFLAVLYLMEEIQALNLYMAVGIQNTDISGLAIQSGWKFTTPVHESIAISLTIVNTSSNVPVIPQPNQTQASSQLTPVGTPHVPILEAFGPNYDVFAVAQLSASAFDVDPREQLKQSLDQQEVIFTWNVTPKYGGGQTLNFAVTGIWIPKSGGETIERPLANLSGNMWVIDVGDAFFTFGKITLADLLLALIASVLNVPWIVDLIKKRKEEKKKKQSATPSGPSNTPTSPANVTSTTTPSPSPVSTSAPQASPTVMPTPSASPPNTPSLQTGKQSKKKRQHH
jgi:hypothetical protein